MPSSAPAIANDSSLPSPSISTCRSLPTMHAPPVARSSLGGGSLLLVIRPTAIPQPCVTWVHLGFSARSTTALVAADPFAGAVVAPTPYEQGDAPTYVPDATGCAIPTSTIPSVSNTPACLPSTPSTKNRGTLPRSTVSATSFAVSVQPTLRLI